MTYVSQCRDQRNTELSQTIVTCLQRLRLEAGSSVPTSPLNNRFTTSVFPRPLMRSKEARAAFNSARPKVTPRRYLVRELESSPPLASRVDACNSITRVTEFQDDPGSLNPI